MQKRRQGLLLINNGLVTIVTMPHGSFRFFSAYCALCQSSVGDGYFI